MSLTTKDVSEILRLLEESSFDELTLETGDLKLHLRRNAAGPATAPVWTERPAQAVTPAVQAAPAPVAAPNAHPGAIEVPSPLLGVFYRAPKPGEPAFVEVGQRVAADTVIGIIEVMKLMNSVRAGIAGEVVEIPAQNGALVEYGEVLLRVRA